MELHNILIFSDVQEWRKNLSTRLMKNEFTCQDTGSIEEARSLIRMSKEIRSPFVICLLDWDSSNDISRKLWNELNRDSQYDNLMIVILADKVDQEVLEVAFQRKQSEVYGKNALQVLAPRLLKLIGFQQPSSHTLRSSGYTDSIPAFSTTPERKNALLSTVEHEFRTLMNSIIGMINMLNSTELTRTQRDFVEIIDKSSGSLTNILYDVIDYSRLDTGDIHLEPTLFNIRETVQEVINLFRFKARKQDIELTLNFEEDVPCLVSGDSEKIRQVFHNLLSNAIKYTLHGHIIIHVCCQKKHSDLINLRFEILDTGIGIGDKELELMNHFFEQNKLQLPDKQSGIGLGLYITKQILGFMGGDLHVISQKGEGTTFWFNINMKSQLERRQPKQEPTSIPRIPSRKEDHHWVRGSSKTRQYKILIVEDDIVNQKVISLLVQKYGYKFDIASNGVDAISKLSRVLYDLVLLDIQMPEMNGFETAEIIRSKSSNVLSNTIPIIAMTAYNEAAYKDKYQTVGINNLMIKPIDEIELSILLHKHLIESDVKAASLENPLEISNHKRDAVCPKTGYFGHLNINTLYQMYEEFGEEAQSLVDIFKSEFSEKLKKIKQAFSDHDPEVLKEVSHSLKSNSATFGANELFDICLHLEILGRNNSLEGAEAFIHDLEKEGKTVIEELSAIRFTL